MKKPNHLNKLLIGRNIRQLRRQSGMTIKELSAQVGIQPEPLGNIERGCNAPSARVVQGLARVLGVSLDTFFAENAEEFRLRRDNSLRQPFPVLPDSRPLAPGIIRLGDALCADCLALEDLCGVQKHSTIPLRVHVEASEDGMRELAGKVRDFMDIRAGIVFDYFELFETCGFRVLIMSLPTDVDSFSYFDPANENAFFFINADKNPEKQLFSLAFELGLIYFRTAPRIPTLPGGTFAHLARKFAAFFLMPAETVERTVRQLGVAPDGWSNDLVLRIKHRFGVSAESFLYRLCELGCIAEDRYAEIKAGIYRHYENTDFAEPDSSRRILNPNGRLWDLVMVARTNSKAADEIGEISRRLRTAHVTKD